MPQPLLKIAFLLFLLTCNRASAQNADQSQDKAPFQIQAGQSVYVVAHRLSGEPDLYMEGRLKQAFEKEKVFKPVRRASEAEFVFLVYSEYKIVQTGQAFDRRESTEFLVSASGFALTPEDYAQTKGNLDALRDTALWYEPATIGRMHRIPENLSGKLLKKFHEDVKAPAGVKKPEPASAKPPAPAQPGAESRKGTEPRVAVKLPSYSPPTAPARELPRDMKAAKKLDEDSEKSLAKGDYTRALAEAESALEFKEKQLGAEHAELILTLSRVARASLAKGDYDRAESLLRRAMKIAEKDSAADPQMAELLGAFGSLHFERGDLAQAETALRRAVAILEKSLGSEDLKLAAPLERLAAVKKDKGDFKQAEELLHRALIIQEKKLGEKHQDLAATLYNLAAIYFIKDDYLHAEPLYNRVLDIVDGKHQTLSKYLDPLARIYANRNVSNNRSSSGSPSSSSDERSDAEQAYEGYRFLTAFLFQKNTPVVADALSDLAAIRIRQGKLLLAEQMLFRALRIRETAFGTKHPEVSRIHERFALLHRASGDVWKAMASQRLASEIVEINLRRNLINGSERQKIAYLSRFAAHTDFALSLHLLNAPNDPEAAKKAITILLRHKGRGLDAMTDALAGLRSSNDPQSQALLDRFAVVRAELSTLALSGSDADGRRRQLAALDDELEAIEAEIGARSAAFRAERSAITYETVQAALPADATLVEFALYRPIDAQMQRSGEARYVAYIIPAKGQPRSIELGDAARIDDVIGQLRGALRDKSNAEVKSIARYLDGTLMQPVRKLLGQTRNVLISPDGALNLLPFAALVDEQNRYLVEQYQFTYLTSGRDLLRLRSRPPASQGSGQPPTIFADPDFGGAAGSGAASPRALTLAGAVFTPLPATADEAREIGAILPNAATFVRAEATEAAIKRINAPAILHVATHGFFLEDEKFESSPALDGRLLKQLRPSTQDAKLENPLLRSGLGLAGANLRKSGEDDGILTAFEASALNLWGTKLVVLSACDTGVGEVKNGDGVYGLRRALALAGAETQVMSLWPVSDRGTSELMIAYYKALQAGQGRGEAMRQVQLQLLADPKRQHPYYWASFIVSGESANLDGKR